MCQLCCVLCVLELSSVSDCWGGFAVFSSSTIPLVRATTSASLIGIAGLCCGGVFAGADFLKRLILSRRNCRSL